MIIKGTTAEGDVIRIVANYDAEPDTLLKNHGIDPDAADYSVHS